MTIQTNYGSNASQTMHGQFIGKYRGKVIDNVDPLRQGRILADVPSVNAMEVVNSNWAMPCVPYAGPEVGFYAIPPIGANVWIEYEGGDSNYPIWVGCFWDKELIPAEALTPEVKIWKTQTATLMLNDTPGAESIMVQLGPPLLDPGFTILITAEGVTVTVEESIVNITPEAISLNIEPASITLSQESIEIAMPPTTVTMADEGMEITSDLVSITADVNVEGAVEVEGDVNILGAQEVEGDANFLGAIEVEGDANFLGAIEVEGEANFLGAQTTEGEANFLGAQTTEGDVNVLGAQQIEGNLAVLGLIEGIVVPPLL